MSRELHETATQMRGLVSQGVVQSIDDTGEAQTVTVETHEGVIRSDVPVLSIHGLASNPGEGATCLLLAVGGDQGNLVALPLQGFGTRFGGLPAGGAGICDDAGNRLVFPADGSGLIATAGQLRLLVQTLLIEAAGGGTIHGPMTFTDAVTFQADVTFQANVTIGGSLHVTGPVTGASFNGHA